MRKEVNDVTYSIIGILASILLVIINQDIIINQDRQTLTKTQRYYRWFLLGMLAYLITDLLWGVLYSNHLMVLLYADTSIHFIAMVGAVMLWTQYVVSYLDNGSAFERMLQIAGRAFFALELVFVAVNFFKPVLFWFDENGVYQAGIARYITLGIQIFMFLVTAVYTLFVAFRSRGRVRRRHLTIGFFGIAISWFISAVCADTIPAIAAFIENRVLKPNVHDFCLRYNILLFHCYNLLKYYFTKTFLPFTI